MSEVVKRTAVVTGGTRGIGYAIAHRLAADGVHVMITGTDEERAAQAARSIADSTSSAVVGVRCDVSVEDDVASMASRAAQIFGEVNVLVNNAAIALRGHLTDISLVDWNKIFATNVTGTFLVTRSLVPLMSSAGASIVNVASQAGKRGEALLSPYAASKAAQLNLTKSWALELAPRIRVNAVCPGVVETDMILEHYQVQAAIRQIKPEEVRAERLAEIPLGRFQSAQSIAAAVAWLASDEASELTGQSINVVGGMIMD